MIDINQLDAQHQQLLKLIDRQFGLQADSLDVAMRKIGRRLPKAVHRHAQALNEAYEAAQHPKIALQLDTKALLAHQKALTAAIEGYDRKDALKGRVLDVLATLAFNLLCLAALIAFVLYVVR